MDHAQAAEMPVIHHQDWGAVAAHDTTSAGLAHVHLPMAQPLEQSGAMPNLMPAITALIMQITTHLSQPNGNPQLALTFQPLVNMALNMQLQAWQQASSTAHSLPLSVMEQMHLAMAPQQAAAGTIAMESNLNPAVAQLTSDALAAGIAHSQALQAGIIQQLQAQPVEHISAEVPSSQPQHQEHAQQADQVAVDEQAANQSSQKPVASGVDGEGAAPTFTPKNPHQEADNERESEDSGQEETEGVDVQGDDEHHGKMDTAEHRGQEAPGSRGHRAQRARKRSKLLDEYLTDEEEGGGAGEGRHAKRRPHLD